MLVIFKTCYSTRRHPAQPLVSVSILQSLLVISYTRYQVRTTAVLNAAAVVLWCVLVYAMVA